MTSDSSSRHDSANLRHPTTRRSDDHVQFGDDIELTDLARKASVGDAIVVKPTSNVGAASSEATVVQTKAHRLRARIQFATLCWTLYLGRHHLPVVATYKKSTTWAFLYGDGTGNHVDMRGGTGQFCGIADFRICLLRECLLGFSSAFRR